MLTVKEAALIELAAYALFGAYAVYRHRILVRELKERHDAGLFEVGQGPAGAASDGTPPAP